MTIADVAESQFLARVAAYHAGASGQAGPLLLQESAYFRVKAVIDRVLGAVLLLACLPLIVALAVLVRLTSPGPGIFSQVRVGRHGRVYTMYKLRSMRVDAEARTGAVWAGTGHDPRVTPVGYWLRRFHLDELPQLFNVVKGEMALVGPRPERPEFVSVLAEQIPGYLNRLVVRPGITGLAQVNLPPDTDLDSVRRKLVLDCEYIQSAGLGLDFRILACTFLRLLGVRGGLGVQWMGLKRVVELPMPAAPIGGYPEAEPVGPATIAAASRPSPRASPADVPAAPAQP